MESNITVYFFEDNGWHFGVECDQEIQPKKYVKFCKCLQQALDVLNEEEKLL